MSSCLSIRSIRFSGMNWWSREILHNSLALSFKPPKPRIAFIAENPANGPRVVVVINTHPLNGGEVNVTDEAAVSLGFLDRISLRKFYPMSVLRIATLLLGFLAISRLTLSHFLGIALPPLSLLPILFVTVLSVVLIAIDATFLGVATLPPSRHGLLTHATVRTEHAPSGWGEAFNLILYFAASWALLIHGTSYGYQ